jgi:hypothetical protein
LRDGPRKQGRLAKAALFVPEPRTQRPPLRDRFPRTTHSIALESNRSTSAVITTIAANSAIRMIAEIPTKLSAIIAPLVFIDSVASPITRTTGERLKIRISGTRKLPSNLRGEPEPKSVTNATLPRLELTKKGA